MLRCSFCRKSENDVAKLVAGPNVYICDSCVKIATDIMESSGPQQPPAKRSALQRLLRRLLDGAKSVLNRGRTLRRRGGSLTERLTVVTLDPSALVACNSNT